MCLTKKDWFIIYIGRDIIYEGVACELEGIDIHTDCVIVERVSCHIDNVKLILKEMENLTDEDYREVFKFLDEMFPDDMADFNEQHLPKSQFLDEFYTKDMAYGLADLFRKLGYAVGVPKEYYTTKEELRG